MTGPDSRRHLWRLFRYRTLLEAESDLRLGISLYFERAVKEWPGLFVQRLGVVSLPDPTFIVTVIAGSLRFVEAVVAIANRVCEESSAVKDE